MSDRKKGELCRIWGLVGNPIILLCYNTDMPLQNLMRRDGESKNKSAINRAQTPLVEIRVFKRRCHVRTARGSSIAALIRKEKSDAKRERRLRAQRTVTPTEGGSTQRVVCVAGWYESRDFRHNVREAWWKVIDGNRGDIFDLLTNIVPSFSSALGSSCQGAEET